MYKYVTLGPNVLKTLSRRWNHSLQIAQIQILISYICRVLITLNIYSVTEMNCTLIWQQNKSISSSPLGVCKT